LEWIPGLLKHLKIRALVNGKPELNSFLVLLLSHLSLPVGLTADSLIRNRLKAFRLMNLGKKLTVKEIYFHNVMKRFLASVKYFQDQWKPPKLVLLQT
jgi:hypothetical protein